MYLGDLVEFGKKEDIFSHPLHPYTQALFSTIPVPDPHVKMNRIVLEGSIPSPANPPPAANSTPLPKLHGMLKAGRAREPGDRAGPPCGLPSL